MNSIPLIKGNTPQEINTSIIALKKALDNLQATNSEDLQKRIDEINAQIETLNQQLEGIDTHLNTIDGQITDLQPVDTVTSGDMHSATSNAVASAIATAVANCFSKNKTHLSNENLNNITAEGLYYTSNVDNLVNKPSGSDQYNNLIIVFQVGSSQRFIQFFYSLNTLHFYTRRYQSAWSAWVQIV